MKKFSSKAFAEAQVQVMARDFERATGLPVRTMRIDDCESKLPPAYTAKTVLVHAFKVEHLTATFQIVGGDTHGNGGFDVWIVDQESSYQVWPADHGDCISCPSADMTRSEIMENIVTPFLFRLQSVTEEGYRDWIAKCDAMNARAGEAKGEGR